MALLIRVSYVFVDDFMIGKGGLEYSFNLTEINIPPCSSYESFVMSFLVLCT